MIKETWPKTLYSIGLQRERFIIAGLLAMLLGAVVISLTFGSYSVPLEIIFKVIAGKLSGQEIAADYKKAEIVLLSIRGPRILLAIMVGAALAASGAAYQGLFKNPMVSPDILGVSSGAGVGAALAMLLGFSTLALHFTAFFFAITAVLMVLVITKVVARGGGGGLLIMILAGVVISSMFSSIISLIKYLADTDQQLPAITFWLMGSFAKSGGYRNLIIMFTALVLGSTPFFLLRWKMNALSFGEEEAKAMGVNVKRLRLIIIVCATLLTASSVCLCGTIGWVGLIIPHLTRSLVGPNYRALMPTAMLLGGLFMLVVDSFARVIVPGELPVGILTSFIGAPLFIYMLFKSRKEWV